MSSVEPAATVVVIRRALAHPSQVAMSRDQRMTKRGPRACKVAG